MRRTTLAFAAVAFATACATLAQAPAIKRTLLQRADLGDGREAIVGIAEISAGGSTGRHTHFGIHNAKAGEQATKVIATYVVDKDKPLATPAP